MAEQQRQRSHCQPGASKGSLIAAFPRSSDLKIVQISAAFIARIAALFAARVASVNGFPPLIPLPDIK
jgi:hypothetical protein